MSIVGTLQIHRIFLLVHIFIQCAHMDFANQFSETSTWPSLLFCGYTWPSPHERKLKIECIICICCEKHFKFWNKYDFLKFATTFVFWQWNGRIVHSLLVAVPFPTSESIDLPSQELVRVLWWLNHHTSAFDFNERLLYLRGARRATLYN